MSAPIPLDELIGICDEISALSRARLPLERLLSGRSARGLGGRLLKLAHELETGTSLSEAMRSDAGFPPFCTAVVDAGLESGNLSGALDTMAAIARQLRDARLFVLRALLYPILLFTLLWFTLTALCFFLAPVYPSFFESIELKSATSEFFVWAAGHRDWIIPIVFAPPLIVWIIYGLWCYFSSRSSSLHSAGTLSLFWFIPWFHKAVAQTRQVLFARNLAILVEASVPLERALELVGAMCGGFHQEQKRLIHWARGMKEEQLANGLRLVADNAQLRATMALNRSQMCLPALVVFGVAIVLCAAYIFIVGWPAIQIINRLTSAFY